MHISFSTKLYDSLRSLPSTLFQFNKWHIPHQLASLSNLNLIVINLIVNETETIEKQPAMRYYLNLFHFYAEILMQKRLLVQNYLNFITEDYFYEHYNYLESI